MNSEAVMRYLQENPQFFENYAEALSHLSIPHPHGGRTISITERQMLSLRDQNRKLESKMSELLQFGEENDLISEKMHRLGIAMISASSFQAIIHILNFYLRDDFAVPYFTLTIWDRPPQGIELPEFVQVGRELQTFAETLTHPYCGSARAAETAAYFGHAQSEIRSQALIALRNSGTLGMIALGSENAQRFYDGMGTLYLERLGEIVSAALTRVLRLA